MRLIVSIMWVFMMTYWGGGGGHYVLKSKSSKEAHTAGTVSVTVSRSIV